MKLILCRSYNRHAGSHNDDKDDERVIAHNDDRDEERVRIQDDNRDAERVVVIRDDDYDDIESIDDDERCQPGHAHSLLTPSLTSSSKKRAFSHRTRTGCKLVLLNMITITRYLYVISTCRNRKKKCDENKPTCNNCTKGNFECFGNGFRPLEKTEDQDQYVYRNMTVEL